MKKCIKALFSVLIIVSFTVYSKSAATGAYNSLLLCADSLIPSLFPMLFASVFFAQSGAASAVGVFIEPFVKRVFSMPGEIGAAVVSSVLGGYPAGAATISALYENGQITASQARRASLFCVCAGPGFLIGAVGGAIFGMPSVGLLILIVQISSVILSGIVLKFLFKKEENNFFEKRIQVGKGFAQALTESVRSASESMIMVCAYVVIAGSINSVLKVSGIAYCVEWILKIIFDDRALAKVVLPAIIEVGSGCIEARSAGIPMVAFAVGFGGLAVHCQIYSLLSKIKISPMLFTAVRLICGLYCAVMTRLCLPLLPADAVTVSAVYEPRIAQSSAVGSAALMVMCFMCVMCLPKIRRKNDVQARP